MKIALFGAGLGRFARPQWLRALAQNAERLGFSTLFAPEHVVLFDTYDSKYPYSDSSGSIPANPDTPFADPFIALTYAAACTKTIRLASGICLLPEHNPVVLAKTIATLDQLCDGRFVLGVGIGWLAEEFQAVQVPFERRAQRTNEYVEVLRALWRTSPSAYRGEFVSFENVYSYPKPVRGEVPIWFGGETRPALRRVAALGNGWFGFNLLPDQAAAKVQELEQLFTHYKRRREDVWICVSPYTKPITTDDLKRYQDAGCDEVTLMFSRPPATEEELITELEHLARHFVEPAAKL
jgi:probable F420-dependent oxidoreductase